MGMLGYGDAGTLGYRAVGMQGHRAGRDPGMQGQRHRDVWGAGIQDTEMQGSGAAGMQS